MSNEQGTALASLLRNYRLAHKLSQAELGQQLGLSQETITNYERGGRFPRPAVALRIAQFLGVSLDALWASAAPAVSPPPSEPRRPIDLESFFQVLRQGTMAESLALVQAWQEQSGLDFTACVETIYIPGLRLIGELWHQGRLSVAEEHHLSALIRELAIHHASLAQTRARTPAPTVPGKRWMGLCAPGERHDLPLLFNSLDLRLRGWTTWFLGAQVPLPDLVKSIGEHQPRILALSVTLEEHLDGLYPYIRELRAQVAPGPAFILGMGAGLKPAQDLLDQFDAHVRSVTEGSLAAERLCQYSM